MALDRRAGFTYSHHMLAAQTAAKIAATLILIDRAEGPIELCRASTFSEGDIWARASASLLAAAGTYPASGYDKHDLFVTFEDGEKYHGRLDCRADGDDCDVAKHVRENLEFMAGAAKPVHMTDAQYAAYLRSDPEQVAEALAFLATYQIG